MDKINFNGMKNNIFKLYTSQEEKPQTGNQKVIISGLEKIYDEAQRAVPEYGDFSTIKKEFSNKEKTLNIGDITLIVKPSILLDERPKERELEIEVMSKNRLSKYSAVILRGEKGEILKGLKELTTVAKIEDFLQEAGEKFENLR